MSEFQNHIQTKSDLHISVCQSQFKRHISIWDTLYLVEKFQMCRILILADIRPFMLWQSLVWVTPFYLNPFLDAVSKETTHQKIHSGLKKLLFFLIFYFDNYYVKQKFSKKTIYEIRFSSKYLSFKLIGSHGPLDQVHWRLGKADST